MHNSVYCVILILCLASRIKNSPLLQEKCRIRVLHTQFPYNQCLLQTQVTVIFFPGILLSCEHTESGLINNIIINYLIHMHAP